MYKILKKIDCTCYIMTYKIVDNYDSWLIIFHSQNIFFYEISKFQSNSMMSDLTFRDYRI